jgi:hypothetical protein
MCVTNQLLVMPLRTSEKLVRLCYYLSLATCDSQVFLIVVTQIDSVADAMV